jgi:SecD/SecF fusion protein
MSDRKRHGLVLLLVFGLIAASAVAIAANKTFLGLDLKGGIELIYQGEPTPQTPTVTQAALQRAVDIMNERVNQLGVSQPNISTAQKDIDVQLPDVQDTARAEQEVGTTAQLYFYDWEANVLLPTGKPAASALLAQNPQAVTLSQGSGAAGEGSMPLYTAVKLAAKQPQTAGSSESKPQYYLFGNGGTPVCAAAAKFYGVIEAASGEHCLVAGPDDTLQDLTSGLPPGVTSVSQGQTLVVKPGTVVLQAVPANFANQPKPASPSTQFFVLRDDAALNGNEITNPTQSTDSGGNPDVEFSFTGKGASAFTKVTATIAQRGSQVSGAGSSLQQHFAVALDGVLVTVPEIDYTTYPDGIPSSQGAEITGGFTIGTAQDLANELRDGALPIGLRLIATEQISASLGKQALHQGLIAGLAGLLVVAIFLLLYYRVLGMIAVGGLAVYGLYFFALIKLIPITLTLAGIAGLILTIGVAADANIVIFERVKEEIRAGRNVRQGIAIGYRKGLTAIIDANVVTIMTAFILFVLATEDVKGFAFTLGIGVIVSLFTAVLATQAILMTLGDTRAIQHRSALGAGGDKHVWKIDFMGRSKFFFTLSGTILLIGALAVGGRGLNLGIDFTSGTQITVGLQKPATTSQITSIVGGSPTVVAVKNKQLGQNGFQINSRELGPARINTIKSTLSSRYGIAGNNFSYNSIGPTFGSTVANSAVIAIIASLIVISLYIGIRFEWKFAVPVLIALMHDLLITSGVYALFGRQVTADTVAALLTILGYSLYDTIIVFDRIRENIPRMPRAAFSQIVNRSMSEVLTRSIATTSCTLLPIIALLIFGGSTLRDFAFALLIGVASGAYSSIFIASPVLMHWKEREPAYRARRNRLIKEFGAVPAYAGANADVDPVAQRVRRTGRLTAPQPDSVSAAEFEQMKKDLEIERGQPARHTSTLTRRLAHTDEGEDGAPATQRPPRPRPPKPPRGKRAGQARQAPQRPAAQQPAPPTQSTPPAQPAPATQPPEPEPEPQVQAEGPVTPAPDIAENEGMSPRDKPKSRPKSRNRRHGRRR